MPAGLMQKSRRSAPRKINYTRKVARQEALKVVKSQSEVKGTQYQEENVQLYHNSPFLHGNMLYTLQGPTSGDGNPNQNFAIRIGDELYLKSLRLKLWLSNKLDRPNVIFRILVFWYESGMALSNAMILNTHGNLLLNSPNRESISVVADKFVKNVVHNNAGGSNLKEHSTLKFINARWKNHKITYNDKDSKTEPKKRDLGFAVIPYDAYGTLITDNIASMAYQYDLRFQEN